MRFRVSAQARRELVVVVAERYRSSARAEKLRILDEFVAVTGYHRKHAIRLLSAGASDGHARTGTKAVPRRYDEPVRDALVVLWEASDRVCGKRLRPLLPLLVPALERHGHLRLEDGVRTSVLAASAATIDRILKPVRASAGVQKKRKRPSSLRSAVPIRTFADWNRSEPGSMEADLVAHCGDDASGAFAQTLVLTDVATGWTECIALLVRDGALVIEGLERVRTTLPFVFRAIDTDNGSEFMNDAVIQYCADRGIALTRSRPYRKNDQAWVEQKNGAVVRRLVGYGRLEGIAAAESLKRLYAASRLFVNFFQPSFRLVEKTRHGARVSKRYDAPQTPCARLLASSAIPDSAKERIRAVAATIDPLRLLDEIRAVQQHTARLAAGDTSQMLPHRDADLEHFLRGLAVAWRRGEVRPTHRHPERPARHWRTRKDPFEDVWLTARAWLDVEPAITAKDLLARLQRENPGRFTDGQVRTLQRRVKQWRRDAARDLILSGGVGDNDVHVALLDEGAARGAIRAAG